MTELTDRITAVLRYHGVLSLNNSHVDCACGWSVEPTPKPGEDALMAEWTAHVAARLTALVKDEKAELLAGIRADVLGEDPEHWHRKAGGSSMIAVSEVLDILDDREDTTDAE